MVWDLGGDGVTASSYVDSQYVKRYLVCLDNESIYSPIGDCPLTCIAIYKRTEKRIG